MRLPLIKYGSITLTIITTHRSQSPLRVCVLLPLKLSVDQSSRTCDLKRHRYISHSSLFIRYTTNKNCFFVARILIMCAEISSVFI